MDVIKQLGIEHPEEASTKKPTLPDYSVFNDVNEVVKEMQTMSILSVCFNQFFLINK